MDSCWTDRSSEVALHLESLSRVLGKKQHLYKCRQSIVCCEESTWKVNHCLGYMNSPVNNVSP